MFRCIYLYFYIISLSLSPGADLRGSRGVWVNWPKGNGTVSLFFLLFHPSHSFNLSIYISFCLSLSTSLPPSLFLSVCPSLILFPFLSLYFAHFLSPSLSLSFSLSLALSPFPVLLYNPSGNLSVFIYYVSHFPPTLSRFFSPSTYKSIYLSI